MASKTQTSQESTPQATTQFTEFTLKEVLQDSNQIRIQGKAGDKVAAGHILWRKESERLTFIGRKVVAYEASNDNDIGSLITLDNTRGLIADDILVFKPKGQFDDFLNTGEVALEDTYLYDDTLPVSVNGTIAFKTGNTNESPLLKLQFNEPKNTWNVIGVRLVGYNQNNEPYNIYALASEGRLKQILESQTLEDVIMANIDKMFEENKAELELKLQEILDPLIKAETAKIPSLVEQEIKKNIDEIIEREINEKIDESISSVIREEIETELPKYNFKDKGAYKRGNSKWTGILLRFNINASLNLNNNGHSVYRRINCAGMGEEWQSVSAEAGKEQDPKIKAFFDDLEPYKSVQRLEIMYEDLNKLVGNEVYSKSSYNLFKKKHDEQWGKYWNGSFIDVENLDVINNRQSSWFAPFKKCHYIDTLFYLNGNRNIIYQVKCVGEEPFSVDLREYFPNATQIEYESSNIPRLGIYPFAPDDEAENKFSVDSQLHPAFYDAWNTNNEPLLPEEFKELDYIYMCCFLGSLGNVDRSVWTNAAGGKTQMLESKPRQYNYYTRDQQIGYMNIMGDNPRIGNVDRSVWTNAAGGKTQMLESKPRQYNYYTRDQQIGYMNIMGDNPRIGVNIRDMPEMYMQLFELMVEIELVKRNLNLWQTINTHGVTYSGEYLYRQQNKIWAYNASENIYGNNKLYWRGVGLVGYNRVCGSASDSSCNYYVALPFTHRKIINVGQKLNDPQMIKVGSMWHKYNRVCGSASDSSCNYYVALPFTHRKIINVGQKLNDPQMIKVGSMWHKDQHTSSLYIPPLFKNNKKDVKLHQNFINNVWYDAASAYFGPLHRADFDTADANWAWVSRPCI